MPGIIPRAGVSDGSLDCLVAATAQGRAPSREPRCETQAVSNSAIEVEDLRKSYGDNDAVRGISFTVERGEVFGLLGPNGAGKTTTVEILEGYRSRTSGRAEVLGMDPGSRPRPLRERVGIVLQSSALYRNLTVREALSHFGSLYSNPRDTDETIALVGLEGKEDSRSRTLSGGQQRRLDLALALIGDPEVVFLDEPTTGFDPQARRAAWDTIRSLRSLGTTVVLTTHYLDEAQALADRVAIIKDGRIVAEGKPGEIGGGGAHRVQVTWTDPDGTPQARETDDPTRLLHDLTGAAIAAGTELRDLRVGRPSLEDVYLDLTSEDDSPPPEVGSSPEGKRRGRGKRHG